MRISDWSSDVCSSDLGRVLREGLRRRDGLSIAVVPRLAVWTFRGRGRVRAAQKARHGARELPRMDAKRGGLLAHVDDITAPVLERPGSCLQIHEQRGLRIKGLRLEGFADDRRAKQRSVDLRLAGRAFFRPYDAECHWVHIVVGGV